MEYLLGIDIGTTSTKTIVCNTNGKIIFSTSEEQNLYSDFPAWAEENPEEWWENTQKTIKTIFKESEILADDIKAIGVTGMVPALVLLDKNDNILRRSIQQNDARTIKELNYLRSKIDLNNHFDITGGSINQQLVGPKILWLKENEPEVYKSIDKIMGSYDYINFKLTGNHVIENNWALESGLLNIKKNTWEKKILDICDINEKWLGQIVKSDEIIGSVNKKVEELTGLKEGTPVVGGIADHVSSAFAAGLKEEGDLNVKFGGAGDILYSLDKLITDKRLFIDLHADPSRYMINGCMASSGSLLKWFTNEFCQYENEIVKDENKSIYDFMSDKAQDIPPGSNGVIILPYFLGAKTPLHNPQAKGVIYGLGLHHKKENIYRAIMESVAYGFKHHIEILKDLNLDIKKVIATDGGAKSPVWRQITADVLGESIYHIKEHTGSSIGAAFVAGKGINLFDNWDDIDKFIEIDSVTEPNEKNHNLYNKYYKLFRDIYNNLEESFIESDNIKGK